MTIQDLLDKVAEAGVSLWDLKSYSLMIVDSKGNTRKVTDIKVLEDDKKIKVKLG